MPAEDGFGALMAQQGFDAEGRLLEGLPHSREIGMRLHIAKDGLCVLSVPYAAELVGDPATGVLHGGVLTALLDTACGSAVVSMPERTGAVATLDLRIDYMRPATAGQTVIARAECYRMTRNVGFARALAYHDTPENPIASAAGAFILGQRASE